MGVGGAVGRLVELGERDRRAEFEAAGGLLFCDGDGGLERFLRRRRVGWVTLQQHFAAGAVQFRFERAMTGPFACGQRFVEDGDGAGEVARSRLRLALRKLQKEPGP